MAEPRKILDRDLTSRYFTLEGLERLTGVTPRNYDALIVKELIDNSLDACDEVGIIPRINVEINTEGNLISYSIQDNAHGIPEKNLAKIIDPSAISSSRYLYKYPTRGALGHFWKCLLGMSYAFYSANKLELSGSPITITTQGKFYQLRVVNINGSYKVEPQVTDVEAIQGTKVTITLPIHDPDWLRVDGIARVIRDFTYVNPNAELSLEYRGNPVLHYPNKKNTKGLPFIRESIHWFSADEFRERAESEAHQCPPPQIANFVNSFRGLSDAPSLTDQPTIEALTKDPRHIEALYKNMRDQSKPPSPSLLASIGEQAILERITQVADRSTNPPHRYVVKQGTYAKLVGDKPVSVPYIVEVMTVLTENAYRRLIVSINRSPKLDDPFGRYVFAIKGKQVTGLLGILAENGISTFESATIIVNITCPNIQYKDLGKTEVDIEPFYQTVVDAVVKSTGFYRSAKRRYNADSGNAPETTKKVTFDILPQAIAFVSSNCEYSYRQRQLWYVLRTIFDKKGWSQYSPNYDYFGDKIIPEAKSKPGINLSKLLKEANAELHEPRNTIPIYLSTEGQENYEIPLWKYNKILYIEKRGFRDVIITNHFHEKFDLAVIGGQGESSEASRALLKRIEESAEQRGVKIEILCLHDADLWGHDISLTLSHPSERMKDHNVKVIDLGLTLTEAISLGLKPETVQLETPRKISRKLLRYLPEKELLLLTGKKSLSELEKPLSTSRRVELNAFTPEQFMDWLAKKASWLME